MQFFQFVLDVNMKQERSGNNIELIPRLSSETMVGVWGYDSDHVSTHGRRQLTPTSVGAMLIYITQFCQTTSVLNNYFFLIKRLFF